MRMRLFPAFPLLLLASVPGRAPCQTLGGEILEKGTGQPVQGVLVLLLEEGGKSRAGAITNAAGRFLLQAPDPGRYMIRAERIGYETVETGVLLAGGFVRPEPEGGWIYYGLEAHVLLSDPFLDTHCFRLKTDPDHPGLLGLAFEPTHRARPEVQGTLWFTVKTEG